MSEMFHTCIVSAALILMVGQLKQDTTTYGKMHADIPSTGQNMEAPVLSFDTTVRASCADASMTVTLHQVERRPSSDYLMGSVTRFTLIDDGSIVLSDPDFIGNLSEQSVIALRPGCEGDVMELHMLLSSHDDMPEVRSRLYQFKDGEISYFIEEVVTDMDHFRRYVAPRSVL